MIDDNRTLKWCTTHGDVAWLYDDNSIACFYDAVVEAISGTHTLIELPEIERLREQVQYRDDVIAMLRREIAVLHDELRLAGEEIRRG